MHKLLRLSLLLLFVSAFSSRLFAQERMPAIQQEIDLDPLLRDRYWVENPADTLTKLVSDLPHSIFRWNLEELNYATLNISNPDLPTLPDTPLDIRLPNMAEIADTLVLMVVTINEQGDSIINTMLMGSVLDHMVYYPDLNNNLDFTDDGRAITFSKKEKLRQIRIAPSYQEGNTYDFVLYDLALNPEYLQSLGVHLLNVKKEGSSPQYPVPLMGYTSRLNLSMSIATGNGSHEFGYSLAPADTQRVYSGSVDAVFQIYTSLTYSFVHLGVGLLAGLEANQVGRSQQYVSRPEGDFINYNTGRWPQSRVLYGVMAEYDLRIYRNTYLVPFIKVFRYNYLEKQNFGGMGSELNQELTYNQIFRERQGYSYGGKLKLPIGNRLLFYAEVGFVQNNFRLHPDFIRENYDPESITKDYHTINYGVGCQFLLVNKATEKKISKTHPQNGEL